MIFTDDSQAMKMSLTLPNGESVEALVIPVAIPVEEIEQELLEYEQEDGHHPLANQAKPIARPFLDAVKAYMEKK